MSEVTIWQGLGSAARETKQFFVYCRIWYKTEEISNNKAKVYKTLAIYASSSKVSTNGKTSWSSGSYQIGGTSSTAVYNNTTYYVSAKTTNSGTWYASEASISVGSENAYYTATSGTVYKSTLSARTVKAPKMVTTYAVTYDANGGTGAPATQSKTEGVSLTLSSTVPALDGYEFTGWLGSDGVAYQPGSIYTTDAALTLTAQWKEQTSSGQWRNINGTPNHIQKWRSIVGTPKKIQRWRNINYGTGNTPEWRKC